jgi:hypothetical protein
VDGISLPRDSWDFNDGVCRIRFVNTATPRRIVIER